jgi:serine/threonine-protein kinase
MVAPLEPGCIVAGRYHVDRVIGEGGMGIVYAVRHVHTDEALAMKVLHAHVLRDETAVERFRREARAPARIASDHVARVTDADTAPELGDAPFYVMELLQGTDLERLVAKRGPLPPPFAVELLRQAARALDKAHAIGIVHRDLKPENLFLTQREDGTPLIKLLDFGIARITDTAPSSKKTQAGNIFGTPAYMAPEQALGDVDRIGPATDVWALGLVAFKLLTGQDYWDGGNTPAVQMLAVILTAPLVAPSARAPASSGIVALGPLFDRWFERCVARVASDRFPSAGEAVAALAEALAVPLSPSVPPPPLRSSAPPSLTPLPVSPVSPSAAPRSLRTVSASAFASPAPMDSPARPSVLTRPVWVVGLSALGVLLLAVLLVSGLALRAPRGSASAVAPLPNASGDIAPPQASVVLPAPSAPPTIEATADPPPPSVEPTVAAAPRTMTRDQQQRMGVLERLCGQGTFTPSECRAKKLAILRER